MTEKMCSSVNSKLITSRKLEARQEVIDNEKIKEFPEKVFIADFLAFTTYQTRKFFAILSLTSRKIKNSNFYKWETFSSFFFCSLASRSQFHFSQQNFEQNNSTCTRFIDFSCSYNLQLPLASITRSASTNEINIEKFHLLGIIWRTLWSSNLDDIRVGSCTLLCTTSTYIRKMSGNFIPEIFSTQLNFKLPESRHVRQIWMCETWIFSMDTPNYRSYTLCGNRVDDLSVSDASSTALHAPQVSFRRETWQWTRNWSSRWIPWNSWSNV